MRWVLQCVENWCTIKQTFEAANRITQCHATSSRPRVQQQRRTVTVDQTHSAGIPRYDEKSTTGRSQLDAVVTWRQRLTDSARSDRCWGDWSWTLPNIMTTSSNAIRSGALSQCSSDWRSRHKPRSNLLVPVTTDHTGIVLQHHMLYIWCITVSTARLLRTWPTAALLSQTLRHGVICVLPVVVNYSSLDTISPHMVVGLFLSRVRLPGTACATNWVNRC